MATVNSKMTALADEVRALSGTTTAKSIDAMTTDVNAANTEIIEQTDLIAQIATALEGKAGGGVELPSLSNPAGAADILNGKEAIDKDGNKITGTIATKTSSNLTASGATVTAPAGYYASNATKTIASGSAKTPATTITKNPTISVNSSGLITASVSGTQNVTPTVTAGYVSSGTAGTITVSGSATKQLTTQAAKTVTPTTSNQTAVSSGRYTTGAVTVAAIPSNYEDVATETSAYTTKIASLETAIVALENELEGKAGGSSGGGSVDTCTVVSNIAIVPVVVTKYENGQYLPGYTTRSGNSTYYGTIENVVCGSSIVIPRDSSYSITASGAEMIYTDNVHLIILNITAAAGETVTLSATYLD